MKHCTITPIRVWPVIPPEIGGYDCPCGIAVGADGRVYVTAGENEHQVLIYSPEGELLARWGGVGKALGALLFPRGLALTPSGEVLVVDSGNSRIQRFAPDGRALQAWGSEGDAPGQFRYPDGIALDADGRIYVADTSNHRVQIFSPAGDVLAAWGAQGHAPGELYSPDSILMHPDGAVWVTEVGNGRVQRFTPAGVSLGCTGVRVWKHPNPGPGEFSRPQGLACAPDGRVFVADSGHHRLQILAPTGEVQALWDADGALDTPTALAITPDGRLYIADTGNYHIHQYQLP